MPRPETDLAPSAKKRKNENWGIDIGIGELETSVVLSAPKKKDEEDKTKEAFGAMPPRQSSSSASDLKRRDDSKADMAKLSPSLKALINAPFARPGPCAAPAKIRDVYQGIARDAAKHKLGARPWVTISVCCV